MKIEHNQSLNDYNSYRLNAVCKRAFYPETEGDFISIFQNYPNSKKIILGGGYNVILSKQFYEEDFILIGESYSKINVEGDLIECQSGAFTKDISEIALNNSLSGFEIFYDIPSSIGGAVVMNAGASGEEIKDILVKVRYLDLSDMQVKELENKDLEFSYRNSFFQNNPDNIILKVWLQLNKGIKEDIKDKMELIKDQRWAKQPKEFPNAGSVFKRPKGHFVGPMLDELGFKGYTVGGAKVSEKHSGFIVNFDNATGSDILKIINEIKVKVKEKFDVDLEIEQRII
jgi:UDP-N-acetylmuramate dehydrogenase